MLENTFVTNVGQLDRHDERIQIPTFLQQGFLNCGPSHKPGGPWKSSE